MTGNDRRGVRGRASDTSADDDLSARLKRLEDQLEAKGAPAMPDAAPSRREGTEPSSLGRAMRMSTEFVAGVIAGGALGWLADYAFGTRPWGLIVFLMLGFGAGIYNVMRASGFLTQGSGTGRSPRSK
jgi:ATP synthase protein I